MKAVIPAKANSERLPNKNFRPFYGRMSLCDLLISKLLAILPPQDVFMSCEDPEKEQIAHRRGINFLLRDPRLADNNTPIVEVIRGICSQVPGNDDIMWCQVTDPLFDSYKACYEIWNHLDGDEFDSLVVIYAFKHYVCDEHLHPIGFGFGAQHKISQNLPEMHRLTFTLSILTRRSIERCGYYVGDKPYWFRAQNTTVDIDSEEDFELARLVYHHVVDRQNRLRT